MIVSLRHLIGWIVSVFRSREDLVLENLALRQQLLVLHAERPRRRLSATHKVFWVMLRKLWAGWQKPLLLVTPRTVVDWHQAGFRLYWKWLSRARQRGGRKPVSKETRACIFRMAVEYPRGIAKTWFQCLGTYGLALAAASPTQPRRRQALANVSSQPSRSHCRHGLLHRADAHLWGSILFSLS